MLLFLSCCWHSFSHLVSTENLTQWILTTSTLSCSSQIHSPCLHNWLCAFLLFLKPIMSNLCCLQIHNKVDGVPWRLVDLTIGHIFLNKTDHHYPRSYKLPMSSAISMISWTLLFSCRIPVCLELTWTFYMLSQHLWFLKCNCRVIVNNFFL